MSNELHLASRVTIFHLKLNIKMPFNATRKKMNNDDRVSQKFSNILVRPSLLYVYQVTEAVIGSIVVLGALAYCALLHSACDLNVQPNLIQELMLYKFEPSHNSTEATKSICCAKSHHITIT